MNFQARHLVCMKLRMMALTLTLCSSLGVSAAVAGDFLGADGVISLVKKTTGSPDEQPAKPGKEEAKRLMRDLDGFKVIRSKLAPEEAVDRWMGLYDRFLMLPSDAVKSQQLNPFGQGNLDELSLASLISAIPPPAAWETLKARVLARQATEGGTQETVLRALAYLLTQDTPNLKKRSSN
ncbi:hypothetical protein F6V30_10475 [Oryzomonas sagensis]|uniref:Uncharacterized protein n=1 Tax=Oryzomonas sagensis TaxID=2603857 RepID=A0ABQ6TPL1_9BACT|nr:hypothetical protein [Oryzomonas sagensis]KAB0670553.1 hypothetical protein F6V30_10475 [Oryzomonas sagensis]